MRTFISLIALLCCGFLHAEGFGIIVKFKSDPCPESPAGIVAKTGNAMFDESCAGYNVVQITKHREGSKSLSWFFVIQFASEADRSEMMMLNNDNPDILYTEADYEGSTGGTHMLAPNDTYYNRQWGLYNDGTFSLSTAVAGADIDMQNAWTITQGDASIVVGTIDSGLKLDHPEFAGRIWVNSGEIPNNSQDDDNNGYVDDINGWDFANVDNDPTDDEGHGTNVTGIIGANGNNANGYAGMDWNCKLMTLKGIDVNGSGLYSWWADALYYATDNGANVVNMSVGGSGMSTTLQTAINYALNNNVIVVACMMNTNSNVTYYPAGYTGVIAVGATNANDTRANPFFWSSSSGSNYGSHISVVAPGNYIYGLSYTSNTDFSTYWGGTSQATPHVTGLVALILSQNNAFTPAQVKSIIETSAEDQVGLATEDVAGWDQYFGYGRINAYQALLATQINYAGPDYFGFTLFPNPSSGALRMTIGADLISENENAVYSITDISGKLVAKETVTGWGTHEIFCGDLEQGTYFFIIDLRDEHIVRPFILH